MARSTTRNGAPLWKKLAVAMSAAVAVIAAVRLFHINEWNFFLFLGAVIVVVAVAVWTAAKLLGVRLSLGSWD
ncbi:MAG: hypothetical protein MUD05_10480 [Candidatus Nanopelagicales bacterium]|jgi:membrane protein YdbS with pleckstrin-like domain|nr:hypothetical protein [Candidatus Nanopelagicales bacterium]